MKTIKMSLANIEGKLSRKEMKGIMAGSGGGGGYCGTCYGGPGSWYGNSNIGSCFITILDYCRSRSGECWPC